MAKVWTFLFVFMWLRATLPRLRYDQFMALGWKLLIPVSLLWIMIVAVLKATHLTGVIPGLIAAAVLLAVVIGLNMLRNRFIRRNTPPDLAPVAGSFPIPPIPGVPTPNKEPNKEKADS